MPTFVPPTYEMPFNPEEVQGRSIGLMRRVKFPVGYSVVITDDTPSTYPGVVGLSGEAIEGADSGSGQGGKAAYLGGHIYVVSDAEATLLDAAGYTTT